MRATAGTLSTFEIAIRGRRTALARLEPVVVHPETHRAARLPPLEAGIDEDLSQPFAFGLRFHEPRAGHDQRLANRLGNVLAAHDPGSDPQVFNPRVRAGADEDLVQNDVAHRHTRLQAHVVKRVLHAGALDLVGLARRVWDPVVDRHDHFRRCAPGDARAYRRRIEHDFVVEPGRWVAHQRAPVLDRLLEHLAVRGKRPAPNVVDGLVVDCNQTDPCASFDRHVAQGHSAFHRQRADRLAREFDGVAGAAAGADPADDLEDDVLRADGVRGDAVDTHAHRLHSLHGQALGCQHVLDVGGSDTEGECRECAVRTGVRIARNDRHAGQGRALLGPDHVNDALAMVVIAEFGDSELGAVAGQRVDLEPRHGIGDRYLTRCRRHVVVAGCEHRRGTPGLPAALPNPSLSTFGPIPDLIGR